MYIHICIYTFVYTCIQIFLCIDMYDYVHVYTFCISWGLSDPVEDPWASSKLTWRAAMAAAERRPMPLQANGSFYKLGVLFVGVLV